MLKIKDDYIQELIDATRRHELIWSFTYDQDDFKAVYKGAELVFEHTVEKSIQYDRLALGVNGENQSGVYASQLTVNYDKTVTSNPAYDLLHTLRQAAINQKNETILKLDCGLILNTGLLDILIEDTSHRSNELKWAFDGKQYTGEAEEYSVIVVVHEDSDGPEEIVVTVYDRHHGKDTLSSTRGDRNWHMANKLRRRMQGSIIVSDTNFLASLPEATLQGKYKWKKLKSYPGEATYRCCTENCVIVVGVREESILRPANITFDLNAVNVNSYHGRYYHNEGEGELVKRLLVAIFKSGYTLCEDNIMKRAKQMR